MTFISSASSSAASSAPGAAPSAKKQSLKTAWNRAKIKSLERKAKSYKLPLGELAILTQQLASLLTAGLSLVQCLEARQDQMEDQVFRIVLRDVRAFVLLRRFFNFCH